MFYVRRMAFVELGVMMFDAGSKGTFWNVGGGIDKYTSFATIKLELNRTG